MTVQRIPVSIGNTETPTIFKIINLETDASPEALTVLHSLFANGITEQVVASMPEGNFREVMFHNGVIDPQEQAILSLCAHRKIDVAAAKVGYRYYGNTFDGVYVNKLVHIVYTDEPALETLKPRGTRQEMQYYDLLSLDDASLEALSKDRQLHLSLAQMQRLAQFQKELGLPEVTDVFLETFAAFWSEHCFHTLWKSRGLFQTLKDSTEAIGNPNLVSAFVDNAGVWDFYDDLCLLCKLETHNSPTQSEPFGGQQTKIDGVLRDIFENGLGAKPIGNIELTVIGELLHKRYPELVGQTISAATMARETVRAISSVGNPLGIPMISAIMMSHPDFSGKPFALGGSVGITTRSAGEKGAPQPSDLVVMVGGRTGNDGLHGATVSSSGITEATDQGDSTHVQIALPYTEQLMMRAGIELRDAGCARARNDFGAAGIVSCFGEMGKTTVGNGGILVNLACVQLKCAGMGNWQIALSESQERFGHAIKPEKLEEAMAIYEKYGLEATIIGVFTDTGRFQMIYDPESATETPKGLPGEVCLDVPYALFDECPLPQITVVAPTFQKQEVVYPEVNADNLLDLGLLVVGHFDVCDQSIATQQYDSTVQGITHQGPLYGRNQNIATSLGVLCPIFGKPYAATLSRSFAPWQFEVDPVSAAVNAMMDALVTQVVAGVSIEDIALSDNFYTDGADPVSLWYLQEQVEAITHLALQTKTPFFVGKDSSAGRGTFGGVTVKVPPSVCITALGKKSDVQRLILHQWREPGNTLVSLGPRATRLDGSILSSALGITGTSLDRFPVKEARKYLEQLSALIQSGAVVSAVPVNRGGLFLRLFEGIEASGFGFQAEVLEELFAESLGSVLVEVSPENAVKLCERFSDLSPLIVGSIGSTDGAFSVQGQELDFGKLRAAWLKTFKETVYGTAA